LLNKFEDSFLFLRGLLMIEFSSKSVLYSEFSNFHLAPFTIDSVMWPTVEHYFQAQKFSAESDLPVAIRLAPTAARAKALGKTRSVHFRSDWNSVREEVMLCGLRAKFSQHVGLRDLLVGTGSAELREKAFWDSYWGTGRTGAGKNRMGFLLMLVRAELNKIEAGGLILCS
jgi:ribA/ribD-fused uncharacterized protein